MSKVYKMRVYIVRLYICGCITDDDGCFIVECDNCQEDG